MFRREIYIVSDSSWVYTLRTYFSIIPLKIISKKSDLLDNNSLVKEESAKEKKRGGGGVSPATHSIPPPLAPLNP